MAKKRQRKQSLNVGDRVHAGFGARGGAGFVGRITKIEDDFVTIQSDYSRPSFGSGKPYYPKYKGPSRTITKL